MTKPTPTPTNPPAQAAPAAAIYIVLRLPEQEPFQAGVDLSHPQWEQVLDGIVTDVRLAVFRYLLAEARKPAPESPAS